MIIKYLLILINTILLISPTSIAVSADFQDQYKESYSDEEIPELKKRSSQSLKEFKNQAEPEKLPSRSTDPIQGNCDKNKLPNNCKKTKNSN